MLKHLFVASLIAAGATTLASAQTTSQPVASESRLEFHSDLLMNLHHTLYGAAWARRPEAGTLRALAGPLPSALDAEMTREERTVWDAAVDYYDKQDAPRDLLFGRGMRELKMALVAGDLSEMLQNEHPWVRSYFHGKRGERLVASAA